MKAAKGCYPVHLAVTVREHPVKDGLVSFPCRPDRHRKINGRDHDLGPYLAHRRLVASWPTSHRRDSARCGHDHCQFHRLGSTTAPGHVGGASN